MSSGTPLCYVSMPFGLRGARTGREIDFDAIYVNLVKPAVALAGFEAVRADESGAIGALLPRILELIIRAEAMVTDISVLNANIFYELGVRHAARPQGTVLISAAQHAVPFDLASLQVTFYDPRAPSDSVTALSSRLSWLGHEEAIDSPVYQAVPQLSVSLPRSDRASSRSVPRRSPRPDLRVELASAVREGSARRLRGLEPAIRQQSNQDPRLFIDLLSGFRDVSAWEDVVRVATQLPPAVRNDESVAPSLALALLRRGDTGDVEQAIGVLESVIAERPDDTAAWSLLGRVYRERWRTTREHVSLDRAIDAYRRAWDIDCDVYAAASAAALLARRGDRDELEQFLPQARAVAADELTSGRADFWRISNALELAVLAADWDDAIRLAMHARTVAPGQWALEAMAQTLRDDSGFVSGGPEIVANVFEILTAESARESQ